MTSAIEILIALVGCLLVTCRLFATAIIDLYCWCFTQWYPELYVSLALPHQNTVRLNSKWNNTI